MGYRTFKEPGQGRVFVDNTFHQCSIIDQIRAGWIRNFGVRVRGRGYGQLHVLGDHNREGSSDLADV